MKKLQDILKEVEAYPRSPDEARFLDYHRKNIKKTPDANGNGDDVFKGTSAPRAKMKRHGYKSEKESAKVNESFMNRQMEYSSYGPDTKFNYDKYKSYHDSALSALGEIAEHIKQHHANIKEQRSAKNTSTGSIIGAVRTEPYVSGSHQSDMKRVARDLEDYASIVHALTKNSEPYRPISEKKKGK